MKFSSYFLNGTAAFALLPTCWQAQLSAMPPPTPEMVQQYKADGTWSQRLERAKRIGNHRTDPALVQNAHRRLRLLAEAKGIQTSTLPTPPSDWRGMPTKGTPKMFVLLIDFKDYPADPVNTVAAINARVFGDGDGVQAAPYESLKSYYSRSSYNQLTLSGNVLAYYRPSYSRADMGTNPTDAQRENLIKEALQAQVGHDFSQYDNNGDGKINYFAVLWTGPDNGWANFWWAYQTEWNATPSPVLNGKTLGKYVWQWVSNAGYPTRNAPNFDPKVLIHETGHALGLPDYYDYDAAVGPKGGLGRLDMMDGNWGDHNCFSKWLLDWITPTVYTTATTGISLQSSGNTPDAAIIMDTNPEGNFGEYFMVQNRQRVGNDSGVNYPADGLLIWHVDSRLNASGTNYIYDNSVTDHKLLRLMEADGLEQIEKNSSVAHAGDYWTNGKTFGPASVPNSNRYDGIWTWIGIDSISTPGPTMTFNVLTMARDATPPTGVPTTPIGTLDASSPNSPIFSWGIGTSADPESGVAGYYLQVGTTRGGNDLFDGIVGPVLTKAFTNLGADGHTYYARVRAMNGAGLCTDWSGNSEGVAITYPLFACSALDNCNLIFKTIGPWTTTSSTSYVGGTCAQSAAIPDSSSTLLQTTVTGPGTFEFYWKVSSEGSFDYLTFSIDGIDQAGQISGTPTSFAKQTFAIAAGSHVLRWTYAKDAGTAGGTDQAWVDAVTWAPKTDVNGDSILDLRDVLTLAMDWGTSASRSCLSGGTIVGNPDLSLLLTALGF